MLGEADTIRSIYGLEFFDNVANFVFSSKKDIKVPLSLPYTMEKSLLKKI